MDLQVSLGNQLCDVTGKTPRFPRSLSLGEDDAQGQGQGGRRTREGGRTLGEVPGPSGLGQACQTDSALAG